MDKTLQNRERKIFIGMKAIRDDPQLRHAADVLAAAITEAGHTPFVATDEIARRGMADPQAFMPFVREHIRSADLVIILNHPDLRGGLIEAGIAYALGIPVWLCYQPGERVSSSMRGCADKTIEYTGLDNLQEKLSNRLKEFLG